jgi:hypothetical protein
MELTMQTETKDFLVESRAVSMAPVASHDGRPTA